ncbi:MAG: endonuclease III [Patescibacteria group bacterium]|nr:endonuclease III [Patescibacteria group bacterium]
MTLQERADAIREILHREFPNPKPELKYNSDKPYEFLFAVMLSAQCTDKMVNRVTDSLFRKYTSLDDYCSATEEEFCKDIKSIGLCRVKARNILATARMLRDQYDSKVPQKMEDLLKLPGVARKTANVVLGQLFGINEGIAVDTHVKRLAKALGLTKHDDPGKVEQDLMKVIPRNEWNTFSLQLILYGRHRWPARTNTHDGPLAPFVVKPNG